MVARVRKRKVKWREISPAQFAAIIGKTVETVRGYCLKIYRGNYRVLDELSNVHGLISVFRYPDRWGMRVRDPKK